MYDIIYHAQQQTYYVLIIFKSNEHFKFLHQLLNIEKMPVSLNHVSVLVLMPEHDFVAKFAE